MLGPRPSGEENQARADDCLDMAIWARVLVQTSIIFLGESVEETDAY